MNRYVLAVVMVFALFSSIHSSAIDGNFLVVNMDGRSGYTVEIGGKKYTPVDDAIQVFLPYGQHVCTFSAESRVSESKTVEIIPKERTRIRAPYLGWEKGSLLFNYMPEDAMVKMEVMHPGTDYFTGGLRDKTVPFASDVEVGHYKCLVFKEGYETQYIEFDISKGERTDIAGTLKKLSDVHGYDPYRAEEYRFGQYPDFDNYKTYEVIDCSDSRYKSALQDLIEMARKGDKKALITYVNATGHGTVNEDNIKDDREWALSRLLELGNAGDAESMYAYAYAHFGIMPIKELREYYKKAADLGSAEACFTIIWDIYVYDDWKESNFGPGTDYQVYRDKGAAMGHLDCMFWKAEDIFEENPKEAFQLYLKCAQAGDGLAMHNLAYMYYMGLGVDPDPAEGHRWIKRAAGTGVPNAIAFLASKEPLYKITSGGTERMMFSYGDFEPYRGKP